MHANVERGDLEQAIARSLSDIGCLREHGADLGKQIFLQGEERKKEGPRLNDVELSLGGDSK
jgi:hypothetical protein